ncbi:unnamed protein product [Rangifer tarandus platyrhynchus]|uniref:Uncharacterized protein n=1 Tax=Rangifer tarandus platyrhynchus TaxID=3082113 RepID=A0ABN8ZA73_RANTA|nr:unnamed protein product [Rangifer tarandus platyrhynchus]
MDHPGERENSQPFLVLYTCDHLGAKAHRSLGQGGQHTDVAKGCEVSGMGSSSINVITEAYKMQVFWAHPLGRINWPMKRPFLSLRTTPLQSHPSTPECACTHTHTHTHIMPPSTAEFHCLHDHSPAREILPPETLVWGLIGSCDIWLLAWPGMEWT